MSCARDRDPVVPSDRRVLHFSLWLTFHSTSATAVASATLFQGRGVVRGQKVKHQVTLVAVYDR